MKPTSDSAVLVSIADYIVVFGVMVLAITLLTGCTAQQRRDTAKRLNPIVWDI